MMKRHALIVNGHMEMESPQNIIVCLLVALIPL